MLKRVTCLAAVLSLTFGIQATTAQDTTDGEEPTTGKGFFMVGWQRLGLDELNDRLNTNGFPSFSEDLLSIGGGGWATMNDFVVGGEGHALLAAKETTSDGTFRTRLSGGYGQLDLGYRIFTSERVDVSPMVGLGGGVTSVELIERGSPTFDDVLDDPLTSTRLTASGFLFDVSVVADVRLTRAESADEDGGEGGFAFGVRAGYAHSPGDWEWKVNDDVDAPGGPQMGVRGFYVRLMLGGWGRG